MPKTDGKMTRARILKVAEELFYEHGFDATSVDKIAKAAKVNKALIYYYFKNKRDLMLSSFMKRLEELDEHLKRSPKTSLTSNKDPDPKGKIREEIKFLSKKKKSISVMLMESIKASAKDNYLYKIAEIVIQAELHKIANSTKKMAREKRAHEEYTLVFEFFTGFIPMVAFVALKDTWCEYFDCDADRALTHFVDSFYVSHLDFHTKKAPS